MDAADGMARGGGDSIVDLPHWQEMVGTERGGDGASRFGRGFDGGGAERPWDATAATTSCGRKRPLCTVLKINVCAENHYSYLNTA